MQLRWISIGKPGKYGGAGVPLSSILWRLLGALALGFFLARWSWVLFAPHGIALAVVPDHGATAEAGRIFGAAVSGVHGSGNSVSEGTALPNVHLVGIFSSRVGQPGFAVLKLDEKHQVGVAVGESVVAGTRLLEVYPDYVVLERAGIRQRVNLESKSVQAP